MKQLLKLILRYFLQGLVIIGPIGVTIYAIYFVFYNVDNLIPYIDKMPPGVGFVTIIVVITLIGFISTRFFLAKWLLEFFDELLEKIPGVKYIYTSVKEVMTSFVGDKKKFNHPVWVKTQKDPEIWRIGFLTQKDLHIINDEGLKVAVYLPHSYAISGWVIITSAENIQPVVGMNAAEAMKFAVSGGITGIEAPDAHKKLT